MRLMNTARVALLVAVVGGSASVLWDESAGADAGKSSVSAADKRFLEDTYSINEGEIMLGHLAEQRGTNRPVRTFAQRMITDHTSALDASKLVASKVHVTLPTDVDAATKALYADLSKRSGRDFDLAYLDSMVSGHQGAIRQFEEEQKDGRDAAIEGYARDELPMLHEHLNLALEAQQEVQAGVAEPQKP